MTNRKKDWSISRYLSYVGNTAIAGMMFLTTVDVFGRYFFHRPVLGAYEITEYLMLIMVFSFLAFAQREKAHINVDIVFNYLPPKWQYVFERFNHLVCFIMLALVSWRGIHRTIDMIGAGDESTLLKIPDYPFSIFLVVGCVVLVIEFFRDIFVPYRANKENESS